MGWRERDYARFTRREWDSYVGSNPGAEGPRGSRRRRRAPIALVVLLAMAGLTAAAGFNQRDRLAVPSLRLPHLARHDAPRVHGFVPVALGPAASPLTAKARPAVDPKLVRIRWRPTDIAAAPAAGRICVTAPPHGRVCASYVSAERPADVLTRRLRSLGLRVESSG